MLPFLWQRREPIFPSFTKNQNIPRSTSWILIFWVHPWKSFGLGYQVCPSAFPLEPWSGGALYLRRAPSELPSICRMVAVIFRMDMGANIESICSSSSSPRIGPSSFWCGLKCEHDMFFVNLQRIVVICTSLDASHQLLWRFLRLALWGRVVVFSWPYYRIEPLPVGLHLEGLHMVEEAMYFLKRAGMECQHSVWTFGSISS